MSVPHDPSDRELREARWTAYALGQLARRYYAGGRVMNAAVLHETFQTLLGPAKEMQEKYLPQIRQEARTLDMGRVMAMVRGG